MPRTPFKLKSGNSVPFKQMGSSPAKQNIFKDPDRMAKKYGTGDFAASGSRSKERLKPGESKYQYDVRRKREANKAKKLAAKEVKSRAATDFDSKNVIEVTGSTPSYAYDFGGSEQFESDAAEYFNPTPSEWKQDKAKSEWLYKMNSDGSYTTKKGESGKEINVKKGDRAYDAISSVFNKKSKNK